MHLLGPETVIRLRMGVPPIGVPTFVWVVVGHEGSDLLNTFYLFLFGASSS